MIAADPFELFWLATNAVGLGVTLVALRNAWADLALTKIANGLHEARRITAAGNVRREVLRAIVQALLLSVVLPGLFIDRPVPISPITLALLLVPAVLLAATISDARERARLATLLQSEE